MSMKAVTMRITSLLLLPPSVAIAGSTPSFDRRLAQCRGRYGAPDHASKCDDREHVRYHLDELRRDGLRPLQLDLQRLGGGEQQTRQPGPDRVPSSEDRRGERDEAAPRGHAVGELVLVERE